MANLNVPFLLLQPSTCRFKATIETTKIVSYDKYNIARPAAPMGVIDRPSLNAAGGIQNQQQTQQIHNGGVNRFGELKSQHQQAAVTGATKFEFGKYSTFDDTPKNLMITSDEESGDIVLWHQDSYSSQKALSENDQGKTRTTKFLMSVIPRVAMTPSISSQTGPLLSYCFIKSPAPSILSTSVTLMVTLHRDSVLRLWTTDDGRCILASKLDLLPKFSPEAKPTLKAISSDIPSLSGIVAIACSEYKEIHFFNAYKMSLLKKLPINIKGVRPESRVSLSFHQGVMIAKDCTRGCIQVWTRGDMDTNRQLDSQATHSTSLSANQQACLDMTNAEDSKLSQLLLYIPLLSIGSEQGITSEIVACQVNTDQLTVVTTEGIVVYNLQTKVRRELVKGLHDVKFAKFLPIQGVNYLMTVDDALEITVFDYEHPKVTDRGEINAIIYRESIILKTQLFEEFKVKTEGMSTVNNLLNDPAEKAACKVADVQRSLKAKLSIGHRKVLKMNKDEFFLYTVLNIEQKQQLVCWNLKTLFSNLNSGLRQGHPSLPLSITQMDVFPTCNDDPGALINFQPILIKSFYDRNQFAFFFPDERVTDSCVYTSANHPSYIFGTSYGRIFIISMFQETEEDRIEPILMVDSHHRSKITRLFVAYNSSRKVPKSLASRPSQPSLLENGGHLISVSEDGTIAVTNLNSGEIVQALHSYNQHRESAIENSRIDSFFVERRRNREVKRRNSFSGDISVSNFFQLTKVKSQKIFHYASYGEVDKILEIKNINAITQQIQNRDRQTTQAFQQKSGQSGGNKSPDTKHEDSLGGQSNLALGSLDDNLGYACISSEGGTVRILTMTNLTAEVLQLSGLDTESQVLGIYSDTNLNLYYVLTQSASKKVVLYVYNSKSSILLRRVDQRYALDILHIRDTLEQIVTYNEGLKIAARGCSLFDFDTFSTNFFHQGERGTSTGGFMGLGCHKLLDYLSLSLNMPMEFHPHTMFSKKYTKTMQDLLDVKYHILNVTAGGAGGSSQADIAESQRVMLCAVNEAVYMNNRVYQSDFNSEYFTKQSGVTCISTSRQGFMGSKQHIMIANGKQMIQILQQRLKKGSGFSNSMRPSPQVPMHNPPPPSKVLRSDSPSPIGGSSAENSPISQKVRDVNILSDDASEFEMRETKLAKEEQKTSYRPKQNFMQPIQHKQQSNNQIEPLAQVKWPTRLLSLIHPFNVDVNLDDTLEKFMGLNLPFLDFRVGVQGTQESFSFVVTREDEDFHVERNNPTKIIRMLRLSALKKNMLQAIGHGQLGRKISTQVIQDITNDVDALLESEPVVRFYGSEHWKVSSYLSTLLPGLFLSIFLGMVDYSKVEISQILQEWLFIMQRINQQRTITDACRLSLPAASKLLLKKDASISATSKDILIRPILFALSGTDRLNDMVEESCAIIMDTYKRLKKEQTVRATYSGTGSSQNQSLQNSQSQASISGGGGGQMSLAGSSVQVPIQSEKLLINNYFGELELRALICISFFTQHNNDQLDVNLRYRASKLTIILTRELVQKFNQDRRYIHLLTHLLQLLSTWVKTSSSQFNNKAMIGEVIQLLLFIFNINKSPLNRENVITRVTGENFYLIKPNHPELYLKLTAAKALLEIGETFTHEFLVMIHEEATHLNHGSEYQQNVLEILKIFINSSQSSVSGNPDSAISAGVNLEHHLIQLTAILLKCFDPNELALRKNSHKIVSVILQFMVKMFPMVAFHHESQRLAVGTHDGPIAIYDMRTSSKWKILEGHTGNITCLCFDSKGNMLASYSAVDKTLQLWKVGNTGFFSTIMGGTSKSSNNVVLPPLMHIKNPHQRRQANAGDRNFFQSQEQNRTETLVGESPNQVPAMTSQGAQSSSKRVNICSIKFIMPKEKEVELKREDGIPRPYKLFK